MERSYVVSYEDAVISGTRTLFWATGNTADDVLTYLTGLFVSQNNVTGHSNEEILRLRLERGDSPGTVNSLTEIPINPSDVSAQTSWHGESGTGAIANNLVEVMYWNIRKPIRLEWSLETAWSFHSGDLGDDFRINLDLIDVPSQSLNVSLTVYFVEIGLI